MRLRNIPRARSVLESCPLVIKDEMRHKGRWAEDIFGNTHPLHIEIGMGKGQFLLTLAERSPDINYIGIERYSSVLLRAVEKLTTENGERGVGARLSGTSGTAPANLRFLCMDAAAVTDVFGPGEVDRIYLNFSDPWPKARHAGRRLTSPEYFARYDRILAPDGRVEFKTDNQTLFDYSVSVLDASEAWRITALTRDLHRDASMNAGNIMTEYEEKFSSMDHPICKLVAEKK